MSNLTSSIEPVEVPISPGYRMVLLPMVMRVWRHCLPSLVGPCKQPWSRRFPCAVGWDLVVRNGKEGVCAFNVLALVGTGANALA
jgi:hypothetical protein